MKNLRRILRWANRFGLILCAGLFILSLFMVVGVVTRKPNGRFIFIHTARGVVHWVDGTFQQSDIAPPIPWRFAAQSLSELPRSYPFEWASLGFRFGRVGMGGGGSGFEIAIPYWVPLLIFSLFEAAPLVRRLRARTLRDLKFDDAPVTDGEITVDLPCVHCGYNLRTRSGSGLCPECGSPIVDTLTLSAEFERSRPGWLRCLALGNGLLLLTRLLLFMVYAQSFQGSRDFSVPGGFSLVAAGVYVAGTFLLTLREHPHLPSPDRRMARWQRMLAVGSLLCLAAGMVHQTHFPTSGSWRLRIIPGVIEWSGGGWWHVPALVLFLLAWLIYSACVIVEYRFLARLAGRLLDRFMTEHCRIAGTGAAISGVLAVLIVRPIVGHGLPQTDLGWLAMCSTLVAWGLFLVWTGFMNVYCGVRFLKLSWIAAERWRRRQPKTSPTPDAPPVLSR